jgi:hypothetical protein
MSICPKRENFFRGNKFSGEQNLKTDFSARLGKKNFQLFQLNLSVNMIFSAKTFIKLLFSFEK